MAHRLLELTRLLRAGNTPGANRLFATHAVELERAPLLDPKDWLLGARYLLATDQPDWLRVLWQQCMPHPVAFAPPQLPELYAALLAIAHKDRLWVQHILRADIDYLPIPTVLACLAAQARWLWRDIPNWENNSALAPTLGRSVLGNPLVRDAMRQYYLQYCADREPRSKLTKLEPMPSQVYLSAGNAQDVYFAAVYFPYLLEPTHLPGQATECRKFRKRYPGWEQAQLLSTWFANEPMPENLTPDQSACLLQMHSWPVTAPVPISDLLHIPPELLRSTFRWSTRAWRVGLLKLAVRPTQVAVAQHIFHRIGPNMCILHNPINDYSPRLQQAIRLLEGTGLQVYRVMGTISVLIAKAARAKHQAQPQPPVTDLLYTYLFENSARDWSKLLLAGELDPQLDTQYRQWLQPLAETMEHAMLHGARSYSHHWYAVVSRYLPDYIPSPAMTAKLNQP